MDGMTSDVLPDFLGRVPSAIWVLLGSGDDCWDKAAMESFFSTLKIERVHRGRYRTRDEVRVAI